MLLIRVKELCKEHKIAQRKLEQEIGLSNGAISKWNKSSPSTETLNNVANYFGVSTDYLLGKTDQKEKAPAEAGALVNNDPELTEYLEELKNRDEMRMLFKLAKNATKADVMRAVAIIEALRKEDED